MFKYIEKAISFIEKWLIIFFVLSSVGILFANIIMRYIFQSGIVSSGEYARYTMVFIIYLATSQSIKGGSMIKMDLLSSITGERMQVVLRVIANIFGMIMGGILIYTGCQFVSYIYEIRQLSIAMRLPMHMVYAIVPVGGLLIIFRSIVDVIDTVRRFSAMGTIAAMEK